MKQEKSNKRLKRFIVIPCPLGTFHDLLERQESEGEASLSSFPSLVSPSQALRSSPFEGRIYTESGVREVNLFGFGRIS